MTKEQFLDDLKILYKYLDENKNEINRYYEYLENNEFDKLVAVNEFAKKLELDIKINGLRVALTTRLINLRDDSLVQILKKLEFNDERIVELQESAYKFVRDFWEKIHKNTLDFLEEKNLLTPFYREIFAGVYHVGTKMSIWQSAWTAKIINGVNKELEEKFDGDKQAVMKYLKDNNLLDKGHGGETADRSYSMLVKNSDGVYEKKAYIDAFKKEVTDVVDALEAFADRLIELEDEVYGAKWDYVLYIQSLIKAFSEDRTDELVSKWADVDRAWMSVQTPIQIGHPLEYYEDHFRKAVALEWDIRLANPNALDNTRVDKIRVAFKTIFDKFESKKEYKDIFEFANKSLNRVQLYIGRPASFFGAEFNGLFSAQVVPNDEVVSLEHGKKIFAFSDEILQSQRAKPFLLLSREIFGQEFLKQEREFLFNEDEAWHQVYDITTIGHEYGHILWCDEDTESVMNEHGNFKNIEEFKATTGGLVSFYLNPDNDTINKDVLRDTIKRAVGLIGWMEVGEVEPYYCEGLIHLTGLFETKVLSFDGKTLKIDMSDEKYESLKTWYINTYTKLANTYLDKKDANEFLYDYAKKDGKYFMPIASDVKTFVKYYFERYKEIGQDLDTVDKKSNYTKKA